jgi:hypothetical protein
MMAVVLTGCFGQSKATGKFGDQDKPKASETSEK